MNYLEVYFNGILKQSIPVQTDVITIGRASSNDIIIKNMGVSNHHAIITKKNDLFYLEDLNSTNGSFLNSQRISSQQKINPQDSIIIGKHTLKFSEWSQAQGTADTSPQQKLDEATMIMSASKKTAINQTTTLNPQHSQFYLIVRGELSGINKLLLTENTYGIGKAKDNKLRIGGWFTSPYIAEIEKIRQSFYISPLKKNNVKLNGNIINSSILLSPLDEIKIKNLVLKFLSD